MATKLDVEAAIETLIDNDINFIDPKLLRGVLTKIKEYIPEGGGTLSFNSPITFDPFTGQIAINQVTNLQDGYLSKEDYILLKKLTQLRQEPQIYTSGAQEFTLPEAAAQIVLVTGNGGVIYDYTILSDTLVRIDLPLVPTVRVVIHYLVDLNLGAVPYYTQAQVDAMLAGIGGVMTYEITNTDISITNETHTTVDALDGGFWYEIGDYVFVELIFDINFFPSSSFVKGSFNLEFLNGLDLTDYIGRINKSEMFYPLTVSFNSAYVTGTDVNSITVTYNTDNSYIEMNHKLTIKFNFKK